MFADGQPAADNAGRKIWREWEGVEPTYPVLTRHNGFEVRKSHRAPSTPIAEREPDVGKSYPSAESIFFCRVPLGTAPTICSTGCPSLNKSRVGMLRIP